jgi:hypothetical protein
MFDLCTQLDQKTKLDDLAPGFEVTATFPRVESLRHSQSRGMGQIHKNPTMGHDTQYWQN